MTNRKFKVFKDNYLSKFRKYYRDKDRNTNELKRSVYDNPKLTEYQKNKFWSLVQEK